MTGLKISDLMIFTDEIKIGKKIRQIAFSNRALGYAEQYCKAQGFPLDTAQIIKECSQLELRSILACLYGAIRAKNEKYTIVRFTNELEAEKVTEYFEKVTSGLQMYLPEKSDTAETGEAADGAEKDVIGDYFELARQVLKMTDEEILDSSMRIIEHRLSLTLGIEKENDKTGYIDDVPGF